MLRVAVLGSYGGGQAVRGGAEAALSYLVHALSAYPDLEVHIVAYDDAEAEPEAAERVPGRLVVHRLRGLGRGHGLGQHRALARELSRCLDALQPDVVHAHDLRMGAAAVARYRDRTVVTIHGIVREEARYAARRRERLRTYLRALWLERACLGRARWAIAISPYVRRYYPALAEREAYDIPNAIDPAFFALATPGGEDRLLYAGRVIPRKRVRELIEIVDLARRERPGVTLRVAGDLSAAAYVARLRELVRARGLERHVQLLGQLDEAAVLEEFERASAVVLASGQETAPMVIAQAMAAGKPVIATAVGGVPEMVRDGETGYVLPIGDRDGFARRVVEVLADPALAATLGQRARAEAIAAYRADVVAARTRDVYYRMRGRAAPVADAAAESITAYPG